MPFQQFDRSRLNILPLSERIHDLSLPGMLQSPAEHERSFEHPALPILAQRSMNARSAARTILWSCGAHVLRQGNGPLIIDLMERGLITHLALNGAGAIHDFELAMIGHTCESVARYVREGQFGLWQESSRINDAVNEGSQAGLGFGEAVGRYIEENGFPNRDSSVLAAGFRLQVPVTIHVSIGQDIVHEHPNFDGGLTGAASYRDFLIYTQSITNLENGVFLNLGSAVMGPEVYLKALAMARNVAHQEGQSIRDFTTAVFDLPDLGDDLNQEAPKDDPRYYFRPFKTILVRTVADGGESYYVKGDHRVTVPALYDCLNEAERGSQPGENEQA